MRRMISSTSTLASHGTRRFSLSMLVQPPHLPPLRPSCCLHRQVFAVPSCSCCIGPWHKHSIIIAVPACMLQTVSLLNMMSDHQTVLDMAFCGGINPAIAADSVTSCTHRQSLTEKFPDASLLTVVPTLWSQHPSMLCFAGSAVTSETRFLSADQPDGDWKVILPRENGVEYDIKHRGDHFFIEIRDSDRPNSEVLVAPVSNPTQTKVCWMLNGPQALHCHMLHTSPLSSAVKICHVIMVRP